MNNPIHLSRPISTSTLFPKTQRIFDRFFWERQNGDEWFLADFNLTLDFRKTFDIWKIKDWMSSFSFNAANVSMNSSVSQHTDTRGCTIPRAALSRATPLAPKSTDVPGPSAYFNKRDVKKINWYNYMRIYFNINHVYFRHFALQCQRESNFLLLVHLKSLGHAYLKCRSNELDRGLVNTM